MSCLFLQRNAEYFAYMESFLIVNCAHVTNFGLDHTVVCFVFVLVFIFV